jgi:zinc transporter ZupT
VNLALLALSLVALAIGPLAATLLKGTRGAGGLLEGLALVAVCGLVILHVVPHAVAVAGWSAVAVAAAGFAAPSLAEHWRRRRDASSVALVPIVIASFGAHAFIDGAALVQSAEPSHDRFVALAVVLHRLPDGLAIWSVVSVARGTTVATWVLVVLAAFTALGFAVGGDLLGGTSGTAIAWLQAFVAGSVLHVVMHAPHAHDAHEPEPAIASTVGALLGLGLLVMLGVHALPAALIAAAAVALLQARARRPAVWSSHAAASHHDHVHGHVHHHDHVHVRSHDHDHVHDPDDDGNGDPDRDRDPEMR